MSYRDLEIYQLSQKLAIEVHELSLRLKPFELYEEGSQIRRSSKGVTTAIVEGYGRRRYKADYVKFLIYSHSECDETIVHLDFLLATKSSDEFDLLKHLRSQYTFLSKKINSYVLWVEKNFEDITGMPAP
jgi:four helix bundle protein